MLLNFFKAITKLPFGMKEARFTVGRTIISKLPLAANSSSII